MYQLRQIKEEFSRQALTYLSLQAEIIKVTYHASHELSHSLNFGACD
ncbi:hypothetical protein ACFLV7_04410 [Chloroflexota bacterium]